MKRWMAFAAFLFIGFVLFLACAPVEGLWVSPLRSEARSKVAEEQSLFPAYEAAERHTCTQLARVLLADRHSHEGVLVWQIAELRLATQLRLWLRQPEREALLLSRASFGAPEAGASAAAAFTFGKSPSQLDVAQRALLVGLLQRPGYFQPFRHPDRALLRRSQVIDAMVSRGTLTAAEAEAAKALPLELRESK